MYGNMKTPIGKLNRKMELAISALLQKPNLQAAAEVTGIHVQTLKGWLKIRRLQGVPRRPP